ncbi:MAG TPA: ZIP family metal transporter [Planctomycetota bacterium]|nr:ZIP family metal transporter [Planctomycetota bacterium]
MLTAATIDAVVITGAASLAGGFGAFIRGLSPRATAAAFGVAGGMMLAASLLALLPQALAQVPTTGGGLGVVGGFLAGVAAMWLLDLVVPHQHPDESAADHGVSALRPALLITLAIGLHNLPEGAAVGLAAAGGEGGRVTWAIAVQNVVEGLLVAVPLRLAGLPRWAAFGLAAVAAAAEIGAALLAGAIAGDGVVVLALGMAFAAGAMCYVVFEELMPAANRTGHGNAASLGASAGIAVTLALGVV